MQLEQRWLLLPERKNLEKQFEATECISLQLGWLSGWRAASSRDVFTLPTAEEQNSSSRHSNREPGDSRHRLPRDGELMGDTAEDRRMSEELMRTKPSRLETQSTSPAS